MNKKAAAIFEAVFDTLYLVFAVGAGIFMIIKSGGNIGLLLYGIMALTLGLGDSFHLVPRIYGKLSGRMDELTAVLGRGKFVTSITMTVFYVILYHAAQFILNVNLPAILTVFVWLLAAARIILCLFPQNEWAKKDASLKFAVYRNIPFALLGILVLVEYAVFGKGVFSLIPIAVFLSFGFYIPVVLFAHKKPALGALMLPKTLAYVWIITMGFSLF